MKNCIYKIESIKTKRIYIGSSINSYKRKFMHFNNLKKGKHCNSKLQRHFDKYGIDDLVFSIIEYDVPLSELISREQFYIDRFDPFFNMCKVAGSRTGTKHKKSTKDKIRISLLGVKHTEDRKKNISNFSKGKKKKPQSELHKENIRKAKKGLKLGPQTKEHIEKRTKHLYGNSWNKGKENRNTPIIQLKNGIVVKEFKSLKQASNELKTTASNLCHALRGRTKSCKGYEFLYKKDFMSNIEQKMV